MRLAAGLLLLAALSAAARAQGPAAAEATPPPVVLLTWPGGGADEVIVRVRGELTAAGYTRVDLQAAADDEPAAALAAAVASAGARAGVAVVVRDVETQLWIAEAGSSPTRIDPRGAPGDGPTLLAVRAVERLRFWLEERPPAPVIAAPPAPPPPPDLAVDVGVAAIAGLPSVAPSWAPLLRARVGQRWQGRLSLAGLGTRAEVTGGVHQAELRQELGWVELARVARASARLRPSVGVGAGVWHVHGRGRTGEARAASLWTPVLSATVGLDVALSARFLLALTAGGWWSAAYPIVRLDGREEARGGRPAWLATTALVVNL